MASFGRFLNLLTFEKENARTFSRTEKRRFQRTNHYERMTASGVPDHVTVPRTFTSGGTIYNTVRHTDGQYYAVLRGKTMADSDHVFKIKWAYGTKGDYDSEFYFVNVVTRKKGWTLPDLGADAVPDSLLSAIGKAATAAASANSSAFSSPASARPHAPTQEIVAKAAAATSDVVASPRQAAATSSALDAAFASPARAQAPQSPAGSSFASPGAAPVVNNNGDRRADSATPPSPSSSSSRDAQPKPVATTTVPLKIEAVGIPSHSSRASPSPTPSSPAATVARVAATITAKDIADNMAYGAFDEKDVLDVPLLKHELQRMQQSLQDRDQIIAQFAASFDSHQVAIRALSQEVHRLKDRVNTPSPSPSRDRDVNNNESSSSSSSSSTATTAAVQALTEAHRAAIKKSDDEVAFLKKELAAVRSTLEHTQEKLAVKPDTATQMLRLQESLQSEKDRGARAEQELKTARADAHRETEALKRALEKEQERSAAEMRSKESIGGKMQETQAELQRQRGRVAAVEAALSKVEASPLVRMTSSNSSSAGDTVATLMVPSMGSSSNSSVDGVGAPLGKERDIGELVANFVDEIVQLRSEVKQLRKLQVQEAKADSAAAAAAVPVIAITAASPVDSPTTTRAAAAAATTSKPVASTAEQDSLLLRNSLILETMCKFEAEQRNELSVDFAKQLLAHVGQFFAGTLAVTVTNAASVPTSSSSREVASIAAAKPNVNTLPVASTSTSAPVAAAAPNTASAAVSGKPSEGAVPAASAGTTTAASPAANAATSSVAAAATKPRVAAPLAATSAAPTPVAAGTATETRTSAAVPAAKPSVTAAAPPAVVAVPNLQLQTRLPLLEGSAIVSSTIECAVRFHELLAQHYLQLKACALSESAVALAHKAAARMEAPVQKPGGWAKRASSPSPTSQSPPQSPRDDSLSAVSSADVKKRVAGAELVAAALAQSVQAQMQLAETAASLVHEQKSIEFAISDAAVRSPRPSPRTPRK